MTTKVYFNDTIRAAILSELEKAEHEIYVAVAWFNDIEIFNILLKKAAEGKNIELLISNDPNNFGETNSLNFSELVENGGKVNRLITDNVLMHNKFCVIDNHTVITGSYNWTFGAFYKNLENIVIIENDIKLCETFKAEYRRILSEYFQYIQEFDTLLQQISEKVNQLREQNKSGLLDPNWIINILNKQPNQFMLSDGYNFEADDTISKNNQINSSLDWWESLPKSWKFFFNDKILPNGRVENKPPDEALQYIKNIETISCMSYFIEEKKYDKVYKSYQIQSVDGLENLNNLKELTLSDNNLTQNSLNSLGLLKSLEKLDLSKNKITALPLNYPLPNLRELNISENLFVSLDFLSNLPNLEILFCTLNSISGHKGLEKANKLRLLFIDKRVYDLPFINAKLNSLNFEQVEYENKIIVKLERSF